VQQLNDLAEELGAVAGQIEREANLRLAAAISDLQRHETERELRFHKLERLIEERLASLKDGEPGAPGRDGADGKDGAPGMDGRNGDPGPQGQQGEPGERGEAGLQGLQGERGEQGESGQQGERGEPGPQGERGDQGFLGNPGEVGPMGPQGERGEPGLAGPQGEPGLQGERGERGAQGDSGLLPMVRSWADEVHYASQVVTHGGGLYQALRDTAKEPPHADWICLAAPGRDGSDGRSFTIRGTFRDGEDYAELDVVTLNGASFAAKRDNPGVCPGDGWQLVAMQGGRGKPGERGPAGGRAERGPPGPKVADLSVDDQGVMTLTNEDGSIAKCDLYPLLSRLA
jgi:hypothetical protein